MNEGGNMLEGIEVIDLLQPADDLAEEMNEGGNILEGIEAADLL